MRFVQPAINPAALRGQELTVDIRETGTFNGSDWIGTPLADVSGFANTIQRGVDQLLTTGGTIARSPRIVPVWIGQAADRVLKGGRIPVRMV